MAFVENMNDYIMPSLRKKPDEMILHVGTINIKYDDPQEIAEKIVQLATTIQHHSSSTKVTISSLIIRDDANLNLKINEVNRIVGKPSLIRTFLINI